MKLLPVSTELQSFIKNNIEGPKYSPFSLKSKNFLLEIYDHHQFEPHNQDDLQ